MALRLHTAETNWPQDLVTSPNDLDPMATLMNTYESILLGAKRVGHGLGFIKHPYLLEEIRGRGVAIETCVVSNQILGFMADLRNHPALHYIRAGLPVVLGSDDPGTFGYDHFSVDWYEAFLGWGLDLIDLRNLAENSLKYSAMEGSELDSAMAKWQQSYNLYVSNVSQEACARNYEENDPFFGDILPQEGQTFSAVNVHVFGRHFESAICAEVVCRFGDFITYDTLYISNNHVVCVSPALSPDDTSFPLFVSLDSGETFFDTGRNFTTRDFGFAPLPSSANIINVPTSITLGAFLFMTTLLY